MPELKRKRLSIGLHPVAAQWLKARAEQTGKTMAQVLNDLIDQQKLREQAVVPEQIGRTTMQAGGESEQLALQPRILAIAQANADNAGVSVSQYLNDLVQSEGQR